MHQVRFTHEYLDSGECLQKAQKYKVEGMELKMLINH